MRLEDLAGKWASSWKRSLELMTKLAEQRDDAVRQLEEEWHQHAQSHPESSKPPEAPQLPQPSHQLVEAAAALFPGLQRRQEELKAEAAKREEMLAGLEEVHVLQRDMVSALECQLLERELEHERRTIEFRAIERCADELDSAGCRGAGRSKRPASRSRSTGSLCSPQAPFTSPLLMPPPPTTPSPPTAPPPPKPSPPPTLQR